MHGRTDGNEQFVKRLTASTADAMKPGHLADLVWSAARLPCNAAKIKRHSTNWTGSGG